MKQPELEKLLKQATIRRMLRHLSALSGSTAAWDLYNASGRSLSGEGTAVNPESIIQAVTLNGMVVGFIGAESLNRDNDKGLKTQVKAAAALLTDYLTQMAANRALAEETLDRYREINLLYRIQESIGAPFNLDQIGALVVQESVRVIKAATGRLLLFTPDRSAFDILASKGQPPANGLRIATGDTVAGWVAQNRQAVIINDVGADSRCGPADLLARSLLCAPLTTADKSLGALLLYDKLDRRSRSPQTGDMFTASDQKLLTALASQAAVAIESAREIRARENRLKAQIQELRIEIDEIRKQHQVASITTTDYFTRLQQAAQEMRREFDEEL